MRRGLSLVLLVLLLAGIQSGCGSSSPTPTPTPPPPTSTPPPTTPTPIAYDLPAIVQEYLVGARPIAHDTFDTLDPARWTFTSGSVTTSLGEAQVTGVDGWGSRLYRAESVPEGTAVLVRFRSDTDAEFGIYVESGAWGTPEYKRFGTYGPYPETNIFRGTNAELRQELAGDLVIQPEVWYELMLAIGPGGEFLALIWDPETPEANLVYRRVVDRRWTGATWTFGVTSNAGFLALDDFALVAFAAMPG